MARHLQVRLSVTTFDVEAAARTWSKLYALAWPAAVYRPEIVPMESRGVLEMVQALDDQFHFGEWNGAMKEQLGEAVEGLMRLKQGVEQALAEWDAKTADRLAYELEDRLDELEKVAGKL